MRLCWAWPSSEQGAHASLRPHILAPTRLQGAPAAQSQSRLCRPWRRVPAARAPRALQWGSGSCSAELQTPRLAISEAICGAHPCRTLSSPLLCTIDATAASVQRPLPPPRMSAASSVPACRMNRRFRSRDGATNFYSEAQRCCASATHAHQLTCPNRLGQYDCLPRLQPRLRQQLATGRRAVHRKACGWKGALPATRGPWDAHLQKTVPGWGSIKHWKQVPSAQQPVQPPTHPVPSRSPRCCDPPPGRSPPGSARAGRRPASGTDLPPFWQRLPEAPLQSPGRQSAARLRACNAQARQAWQHSLQAGSKMLRTERARSELVKHDRRPYPWRGSR